MQQCSRRGAVKAFAFLIALAVLAAGGVAAAETGTTELSSHARKPLQFGRLFRRRQPPAAATAPPPVEPPAAPDAGLLEAAAGQACQVGAWGAFSACVRTGLNEWSQSRSRPLLLPGAKCPELLESTPCEPQLQPKPAADQQALQQVTMAAATAVPLALQAAMHGVMSDQAYNLVPWMRVQGELPVPSALGLQVGYSSAQQTISLSSSSSNAFSLLVAADPLLLYNAVPAVMYVAVTADVSAIGITAATSTINIQPGQQVSLQVLGATKPIPNLLVPTDLTLRALPAAAAAAAAASGSSENVLLQLSALVMRPTPFDKFGFVQFGDVRLSGAAIGGLSSENLGSLTVSAPITVFGVEAPSSFVFDRRMESLVFLADLPQLDLTLLLHSVGVKLWLGKMDVQLTRVRQSYADVAFNGEYITRPAGMWFETDLKFLGMTSTTKFELTEEGASFVSDFSAAEATKAFKAQTTSRVQSILQGVAAALQSAGSSSNVTPAELLAAQSELADAAAAFEAARKKAINAVNAARSSASAAAFNVDSLRQQRSQALDTAFAQYQTADAAYAAAVSKAFVDASNAKATLERTQEEYSAAVAAAQTKKSSVMLYAYYGMTAFGQRLTGNFAVDVNDSPQELKLMVLDVLAGEVLRVVKSTYKDTQQFLL
ncbi:hypothetical protein OEZ85_004279 [Tetradesmus obliquus]|uniref:Band 7 domain-containing protein n=1 Tax=Tetradesmus obliquus TaxID=3088 RepID=A0ABY8UK97_TETOB|nr:hypothetical protein OEZ85_004279 [Tetradesmus obliquus]